MELSELTLDAPIKFLMDDGSGAYSGYGPYAKNQWLPPVEDPLVLCEKGYHTTTPRHWHSWADAQLWLVETRGDSLHGGTKSCHTSIKLTQQLDTWSPKSQRLLACQIAESVLSPTTDPRAAQTIEVARRYAHGQATAEELRAASNAAYEAASNAASRAASNAASRAASYVASYAASEAASEAASNAAWAASNAAWAAWAASGAASGAADIPHAEWFLATIKGEINQ